MSHISSAHVDYVTLIFVLSSIHPDKMVSVLRNISRCLKPGGWLLFRDYVVGDYAETRFKETNKLQEHFYVRQDGTRAYFFTENEWKRLASEAHLDVIECDIIKRRTVNIKENITIDRCFLQGTCRLSPSNLNES
jgi:methyltransferase-like protein 6